jgi:type I restriction-modification system DNA methylase subunit
MNAPAQFRQDSLQFNSTLTKEQRQEQGIFFTPRQLRNRLFDVLKLHGAKPTSILEPSFGSGEFIEDALTVWPETAITGVEKNTTMYSAVQTKMSGIHHVALRNMDFLDFPKNWVFDLILGNPPYFVTKAKNPACMTGRGNIFVQFIYNCLKYHLIADGYLAFIIPTSFYNCSYYQPCRDYIVKNTTIVHLENLDGGFYDTAQDTMLMVLQNRPPSAQKHFFTLRRNAYLSPNAQELAEMTHSSTTLADLGMTAKTGDVVWNQEKPSLHETEGTLVIYMTNIVKNTLVLNNFKQLKSGESNEKKQRIKNYSGKPIQGPAIVVARGYGNAHYKLSYVFIPEGHEEFYGENHTNVITALTEDAKQNFPRVCASFADPRSARFLEMFVGNCALSKTELETVLPIF